MRCPSASPRARNYPDESGRLLAGSRAGVLGAGSHKPVPAGSAFEALIKYGRTSLDLLTRTPPRRTRQLSGPRPATLRASVGSTEASNGRLRASVGSIEAASDPSTSVSSYRR